MTKHLLAAMLVWGALSAHATTMVPMYLDDLTAASQTVALGTVMASRTEWDQGHHIIYTIYTVAPSEYLKGQLGATFELREPGGSLDGLESLIAGVPVFRPGDEALLFVWTDAHGEHQATAFEQGAVNVEMDAATGAKRATRAIPLGSARGAEAQSANQPLASRVLSELLGQVRVSVTRTSTPASRQ